MIWGYHYFWKHPWVKVGSRTCLVPSCIWKSSGSGPRSPFIGLFQPPPRMQSWGVFVGFASWEVLARIPRRLVVATQRFFGIFTPIPGGNDPTWLLHIFPNGLVKNHQLEDIQGDLKLTTVTSSQDGSISEVLSESIGFSEEVVARTVFNWLGCRKKQREGEHCCFGCSLFFG